MAKGIEYYRCHAKIKALENSEATQIFTERINGLFDALNRRHPAEGIKHKSHDFEVCKCLNATNIHISIYIKKNIYYTCNYFIILF